MRIHAAVLLASLALLATPVVLAHPHPDEPAVEQRLYYHTPEELSEIVGTYTLSNGDVLKVSREGRRYWAEMRATGRMEIMPVGPMIFVEKGGVLCFTFTPREFNGEVEISEL